MKIIGHRGACGYEPENTTRSFEKGIQLGADMLEFDVKRCKMAQAPKHRELIIFHDDTLERTTNGEGIVSNQTIEYLNTLDAGKGEKILTLQECLDYINRRCPVNIEAKDERTANRISQVVKKYLHQGWSPDDFLVSSFHPKEIEQFYLNLWKVRRSLLLDKPDMEYRAFMQKVPLYAVGPRMSDVTEAFVKQAHGDGLQVLVWTVNDQEDIDRMDAMGVDGIFTDYPDRRPSNKY